MIIRPKARPVDRFGAPLDPGDLVAYTPTVPLIAKIADVRNGTSTDPPGTCHVTLSIDLTLPVQSDKPVPGWIRVGFLSPTGPVIGSPLRGPQPDQPPADPPTPPAGPHLVS